MSFKHVQHIKVSLHFQGTTLPVGRLAEREHKIYFEYDISFLEQGLDISPVKCPLRPGVQSFDPFLFEGLPGVFYDSLPDGWGRLLLDRKMRSMGVTPNELSPLDRLAYTGQGGMGALVYEPDCNGTLPENSIGIKELAIQAEQILSGRASDMLEKLLQLNGSSAGARPKAMIGFHKNGQDVIHGTHQLPKDFEHWLVKFPNTADSTDTGAVEYVYALMAKEAGLDIPKVHLFPSDHGAGYFAVKRFDRQNDTRFHMHSACGLLHSDFRTPSLDYEDLTALTMILTRDIREVEKMFRLAVFNVMSHNRDDHGKNFSFLMNEKGEWKLSPPYDLTFSSGLRGEQSTMVMGKGKNLSKDDLVTLGLEAKIPGQQIKEILDQTRSALSQWRSLGSTVGVRQSTIELVEKKLCT